MLITMLKLEQRIINSMGIDRFLSIQIDITNFCNLECIHCYHPNHENSQAINLFKWFEIITQYEELITKLSLRPHLVISGGEPMTSPFLIPILEFIYKRKIAYHVTILTNGVLISKFDLNKIPKVKNIDFQISVDGPDALTHDYFRGPGSFSKSILGIKKLINFEYRVSLLATLTKFNCSNIDRFFELASSLGVDEMNFTRLIAIGHGESLKKKSEHVITPNILKETYRKIIVSSAKFNIRTNTELPLMNLIHPTLGKRFTFNEGIVVDHEGNMLISSRSRVKIGSLVKNSLEELFFKNDQRLKFLNKENYKCYGCKHFDHCGGDLNASFAEYGSFFEKDPGCWINIESA